MLVRKYSGGEQAFDPAKLRRALSRGRASRAEVDRIQGAVEDELYPGIRPKDIYTIAFKMLEADRPSTAARYNLKWYGSGTSGIFTPSTDFIDPFETS